MPKNQQDVKPPSRRENVYRPPESSEASGASGASTGKMAEYQTPQQQHTRPPDDNTLKNPGRRPLRKSILQQDIDDDDLNADEAPQITKARETFNDIPDPTPAEIGRMLSGRLDYVQSRHARHFDEMEARYAYNFDLLEKRIAVNNNVQLARMQEMINDSNDNLKATFGAEMIKTLRENNVIVTESPTIPQSPMPPQSSVLPRKPLKRDNAPIESGDEDSDEDGGSILLRRRGTRAGRLTRDHQKPNRHPRFEDLEDRRPLSPLTFPQDTPLPRHSTVPVSPPPKPDRLRSQSALTTTSSAREDSSFKVQEIGFFHPALQIDDKNPEGPFVTTGKDVVYRDVNMFVAAAKRVAKRKTNDVVASHLQLCLRGSALTWFSTLKESMQGALNDDLNLFCEKLFAKYRLRPSQALDKLHAERFTMADAARNRHADEYVQNVVLLGSQCGMTAEASLAMAWKNLDPEIQRDVRRPNDSIDEFSQELDEAVEYWFLRKSHDKGRDAQDSGYSSPDAIEAGYQRGLRAGERRASNQQQQQRQPYGQQYRPQGNYQGPRDRNRDRFRPDTHHVDEDYAYHGDGGFVEEDPELPPESEVFFNDSAWERRDGNQTTPPFACKKCVRRFRNGDELRDHLMNAHGVDPRASTYSYHINADVYPPTAKGFAMVKAGMPDGQPKDICIDTGSSISLIDAAFAKELNLDMQYTRMMHLRGIGNQRTTTYVKFPIYISGIEVWVTAYVIYVKSIRVILGMDTLRANQMDVLTSKDLLKIKDKEVPLRYAAALTAQQIPQDGEATTTATV